MKHTSKRVLLSHPLDDTIKVTIPKNLVKEMLDHVDDPQLIYRVEELLQVRELQSQLEEMNDNNKEVITLLKNALEYYHNDKFANRAKSMKSFMV